LDADGKALKRFHYKARDPMGRMSSGELLAEDDTAASRIIQEAGLFVVEIQEAKPRRGIFPFFQERLFIPLEERLFLLQTLAVLLHSGFSIQSALLQIQKGTHLRSVEQALRQIQHALGRGMTFSEALAASGIFQPSWIAAIRAAENTGDIVGTLQRLRERALQCWTFKRSLLDLIIGPSIVLALVFLWLWLFIHQVVPTWAMFISDMGGSNVWVKFLESASHWISAALQWCLVLGVLGLYWIWRSGKTDAELGPMQTFVPTWWPGLGSLAARLRLVDIASALRIQVEAGIPITEAVYTISQGIPHARLRNDLFQIYCQLRDGVPISEAFQHGDIFPSETQGLIKVGETTGKLPEMLETIIEETEAILREQMKRLVVILRTISIGLVATLVGLLVVSFFSIMTSVPGSLFEGWKRVYSGPQIPL
jgi:type IV pilus assembly protein PilC